LTIKSISDTLHSRSPHTLAALTPSGRRGRNPVWANSCMPISYSIVKDQYRYKIGAGWTRPGTRPDRK